MQIFLSHLGMVDKSVHTIHQLVKDYDERLYVDRHNGEWVIKIAVDRPNPPIPVLSLNAYMNKDPRDVLDWIRKNDTKRHASDMRDLVNKHNAQLRKDAELRGDSSLEEGARVLEHVMRKVGKSKVVKSTRNITRKR